MFNMPSRISDDYTLQTHCRLYNINDYVTMFISSIYTCCSQDNDSTYTTVFTKSNNYTAVLQSLPIGLYNIRTQGGPFELNATHTECRAYIRNTYASYTSVLTYQKNSCNTNML